MNPFNQKLDEILDKYYAPIKLPDSNREGLKQAILSAIKTDVIGEDEPDETDKWTPEMAAVISETRRIIYGRNALRASQRQLLEEKE